MAVYGCWGSFALTGISGVDLPFVGYGSLSPARLLKIDMVLTKLGWSDRLSNPGPFSLTGILGGIWPWLPFSYFFFFKYDFLDSFFSLLGNIWGSIGSLFAAEILIGCLALTSSVVPFIFLGY